MKKHKTVAAGTASKNDDPRVLDAVVDQGGKRWIQFGTSSRSVFFSMRQVQHDEREVYDRLSTVGLDLFTDTSRRAFKKLLEEKREYRSAIVAELPGWLAGHFVFGDGTVASPSASVERVIIGFTPNQKFERVGTLTAWQQGVGNVVAHQAVPLTILCASLIGPLLGIGPKHLTNPIIDIVGAGGSGKSTLAILAASVWAGNPYSTLGGGESWSTTLNALDGLKRDHSSSLLVLDETNLIPGTSGQVSEFLKQAVFKLERTGGRRRHGDKESLHSRAVIISTGNVPLSSLVKIDATSQEAALSRVVTIPFVRSDLEKIPGGGSVEGALHEMVSAVGNSCGVAGRAFVERLMLRNWSKKSTKEEVVGRWLEKAILVLRETGCRVPPRTEKTFALMMVAGWLARDMGVYPKSWGSLIKAILTVYRQVNGEQDAQPSAVEKIDMYLEAHSGHFLFAEDFDAPDDVRQLSSYSGVIGIDQKTGSRILMVETSRFQKHFPGHEELVRTLRDLGIAKTERGLQKKLSIKAPASISKTARVYCFFLCPKLLQVAVPVNVQA